ncbi:MAG: iron-sulfur cluster repair di-iron protein [Fibrobacteres bacterium]|nr:iron-sulfur cluster repair di-iron protein [Fibrobacterota bacterium]
MDSVEKWLYPGTPAATVLRMRPLAISIFEKYGIDPWQPADAAMGDLCASKGISLEMFLSELKALPAPDSDTDWKSRPIPHLLDFLTREHWQFINGLLPSIQHTLAQNHPTSGESLRRLRYLVEEWPGFSSALVEHIQEEEAFLFPKILEYDYCLRNGCSHPDFSGGSVSVFVAITMLKNEERQMAGIRRFLNEVRFSRASYETQDSMESRLEPLLDDLQIRLLTHSGLETNQLFPLAKATEKAMIELRISGGKAKAATAPDSGSTGEHKQRILP